MGFATAFGLAEFPQLTQAVSKPWGVAWLVAAALFLLVGGVRLTDVDWWWIIGLLAVPLSQVLVVTHWQDAKVGTLPNVIVLVAALVGLGAWRFNGSTEGLVARLDAERVPRPTTVYEARELEGLPAPVQRYFDLVIEDGQPVVAAVRVEHAGTFNMSETDEQWRPFTSSQQVVTQRPGFVWAGTIAMMPGLPVQVHDAYLAGEGLLSPVLLGLVPLAEMHDSGGDMARGELMRFLAEAAWYPTALLPSQGVRWEAIDARSAAATLTDRTLSVTLRFLFSVDGLIESVAAETRGRTVAGDVVPTPWEGRWWNYQEREGILVPIDGEVSWLLPEGRKAYWRGTITSLHYEYAR